MARYCKNRGEKEGPAQVPLNKFEVLKDRVMQRGEGSSGVGKNRREILREEKEKREKKKTTVQKKDQEKKREKKVDNEKDGKTEIEEEREVEIRGFSGGEILKGRYPLVW